MNIKHKLLIFILFYFFSHHIIGQSVIGTTARKIERVSDVSSDKYIEYAVTLSADGKTMIFESNQPAKPTTGNTPSEKYNLFISKLQENGSWSKPKSIDEVNSHGSNSDLIGGPSLTYDGNILYFFASFSEGLGGEDIYYSLREGDKWSTPVNLGEPINSDRYEGFPSISADGKELYFVRMDSTATETETYCFDIYKSNLEENGKWGTPITLPKPINISCEKAPRIMPDGKTLIFSSKREGTKGGYDIYQSKLTDGGEWTEPVNLSFANTKGDDQFVSVSAEGKNLYFISDGPVNNDIFVSYIPEEFRQQKNITLQGSIKDNTTRQAIEAHILVYDALSTELLFETNSSGDGWYSLVLTEGIKYTVSFTGKGYSDFSHNYDLRNLDRYKEIDKDVTLFSEIEVTINVFDADLLDYIQDADMKVYNLETKEHYSHLSKKINASGILKLPIDNKYMVVLSAKDFETDTFTYDLTSLVKYKKFEQDVELPPIKVDFEFSVKDLDTDEGVDVQIILTNKNNNEKIILNKSDLGLGIYKTKVRDGAKYDIEVRSSKGYSFFSTSLNMKKKKGKKSKMSVVLKALKPNTKLDLKDIKFEYNSADLLEDSYTELKRLVKLMKDNPSVIIELAAHTDDKGPDDYNLRLSDARAQSVVTYLLQFGLPTDRLVPKGYGESQPAFPNDNDENMAKNRRVELRILDIK